MYYLSCAPGLILYWFYLHYYYTYALNFFIRGIPSCEILAPPLGQPTLPWCAQGGPCVPLDAWSVVVTSVFRMVQKPRSTDPSFGSIFGVSTRICAPDQSACFVSSSDDIGWIGRSPTLEVFCVLNFNKTRDVTCTCSACGNTPAELNVLFYPN